MATYRKGEIDVEKDSKNIVGHGTEFALYVKAGHWIKLEGDPVWYKVNTVTDDAHLALTQNFRGETGIGMPYMILRNFTDYFGFAEIHKTDIDYHDIFNKASMEMDSELQKIENRIKALEI